MECHGKGIERDGVTKGKPTEFTVDTRRAGSAPLDVQVCYVVYYSTLKSCFDGTIIVPNRQNLFEPNFTGFFSN